MTDKNTMTDEDTIKALKFCACWENDETCDECPANTYDFNCTNRMAKSALNLANRYEAEIEELRSDKIIAERHEKDARELFVDCTRQLKEAKAEIEKITEKYNCQQTVYVDLSKIIKEQAEELKQAKSEAIKEFAERLIKTAEYDDEYSTVFVYNIKQLVKEMTEVQE